MFKTSFSKQVRETAFGNNFILSLYQDTRQERKPVKRRLHLRISHANFAVIFAAIIAPAFTLFSM